MRQTVFRRFLNRCGFGELPPDIASAGNAFGAALSSSPMDGLWKGDEDVAARILREAVSAFAESGCRAEVRLGRMWP